MRPVEACTGQQFHRAAVEPRMHAVAVELDFVQPLIAFRRRVDELSELRRDPVRQRGRSGTARYAAQATAGPECRCRFQVRTRLA